MACAEARLMLPFAMACLHRKPFLPVFSAIWSHIILPHKSPTARPIAPALPLPTFSSTS